MSAQTPAFPSHGSMGEVSHEGMSLRDYFAAKVLHALIASRPLLSTDHPDLTARAAYKFADTMLAARKEAA